MDIKTFLAKYENKTTEFENAPTKTTPKFWDVPLFKKAPAAIAKAGSFLFDKFRPKNVGDTTSKMKESIAQWLQETGPITRAQERQDSFDKVSQYAHPIDRTLYKGANAFVGAADIGLQGLRAIAGGVQSIGKEINERAGLGIETDKELEEAIFGYQPRSITDTWVDPTMKIADEAGSGALERGVLGIGAFGAGLFLESPVGLPAKNAAFKAVSKNIVKDAILGERNNIETTLKELGLGPDASRELTDSINAILDQDWKQGKKSNEIQNLIQDVVSRSRAVESGPAKSVVQVVGKNGETVFYEVSPQDLKVLSEDVIDGTGRGIAGKEINGNFYHLTAKTPSEMLERAGWKNGGKKTLDEIMEMITPKKRVAIRTEDGRYAGSFMEDVPAYKIAAKQTADEKAIADSALAISRKSLDSTGKFDLSIGEARNTIRSIFDDTEIGFIVREELIDGKSVGKFSRNFRNLIEVVAKDGKVQSDTLHHEAFHGYFNTFIPQAERQQILDRVKSSKLTIARELNNRSTYRTADARAEEWLADDFAKYVREVSKNKTPTSPFADIWAKVLRQIRQWIRKTNHFDTLYKDILAKRRTTFVEKRPTREAKFKDGSLPDTPRSPDPSAQKQTQEAKIESQTPQSVSKEETLLKEYSEETQKAISRSAQHMNEPVKDTLGRFKAIKAWKTNILEYVQNTDERIRLLMERGDLTVGDASNIYQKATLAAGRMGARIEAMKDEARLILDDIRDTAKVTNQEYDALKGEVDDYLIARHAPERNAAIGEKAAGMTTEDALALKAKIEAGPHGKDVVRIADAIQKMNNRTLDILLDSQVITQDLYDLLKNRYQYHVPLYRIQEGEGDIGGLLTGKGFDVRSTGIKAAKGSDKEIDDVIGNIVYNYEQAIIRSEKNIVDLATLQFVRDNKKALKGLMREEQLPFVPVGTAVHKGQVFHEVMDKVNELIIKYGGTHERKLNTRGYFGSYQDGTKKVTTKFGTSKDTLIHEFGHMLDYHFGLREGENSDFFTRDVNVELRKVADLRQGNQAYTRKAQEKIAEFISMYFSDLASAKNVAPITTAKFTKFLEDKPELRELSDVMKSRARSEEIMQETIFAQQRFTNDPKILTLRENGKATYIKIEDANLAVAIRGLGREKLGFLQPVRIFTNFYSGLNTRFNPDFALPNKIRDLQETITYLAAQKDVSSKSVAKVALRDPASAKAVIDFLRGKDTEGARLYKEMKDLGGTTGGMGLSTREQVGIDMDKLDKIVQSKTRRTTEKLVEYVDNWNTIFEDSTRLTVYKTALENGLSKDRAAFLAKEASINFNRMGKGGPVINALWMFSNASIQGSTKMVRALRNPKVLAGVAVTVGVSVAATAEWNDSVDPDWREKVPKWDRMNALPIVLPSEDGEFHYAAIPVSWGIKPIKVMTDYAYDALSGYGSSAEEITKGLLTAILEGYNPVGGTDLLSAITPTFLDTPFEIGRNLSWTGAKIRPTNYNNAPDDTLYFSSLPETTTGEAAISLTELMAKGGIEVSPASMKYAYEQYVGGAGRFINRLFNTVSGAATGKPVALDEYPFIARFYRERSADELNYTKSTETDDLDALMDDDARARKKLSQEAIALKDEIMGMSTGEEKKARLKEIAAENPTLAKKVLDLIEDEKAGLTPQESQLKNATVKVRADYIRQQLKEMSTAEEKKAYLKKLKEQKILTAAVLDELGL